MLVQQQRCRTTTVQLCDHLPVGAHARLRQALPGTSLVQVIHISDEASVDEALMVAHEVDALLLDSGDQTKSIKENSAARGASTTGL